MNDNSFVPPSLKHYISHVGSTVFRKGSIRALLYFFNVPDVQGPGLNFQDPGFLGTLDILLRTSNKATVQSSRFLGFLMFALILVY